MTDALPPEAPDADVAEQRLGADREDDEPVIPPFEPEAPEADAFEQALTLPPDDRDVEPS
jgi:hypothetical protein